MPKPRRFKTMQVFEAIFWLLIIFATFYISFRYDWARASNLLIYVLVAGSLASVFFYLESRALYEESRQKTEELIKSEGEIRNSQKTLDLIFNNSADGIMVLNSEQRIESFSRGLEKISGYKRQEALGHLAQNLLKFHAEKNSSLLPDLMFTVSKLKRSEPYVKNSLVSKDGKDIEIEASYALVKEDGGAVRAIAVIRDVSYEKALTERDKEFIAVTSHQLNTPLSIIRGYSSLLLNGKTGSLTPIQKNYLEEIHTSTEKMVLLTNNLLSISRIEQEKIKLNIEDVNVSDMFARIMKSFMSKAKELGVDLTLSVIDNNLIIAADQEKLIQAISNFLDNSIKYSPRGKVTITVTDKKLGLEIIIEDNGIGIPKESLEKVGEKFFRTQEAINIDNKGTGLGVFISRTIVEKHHGTLNIESPATGGTRVTINLPKRAKESDGENFNS